MDRWAEGILQTLMEIAPKIRENQHDYQLMSDFMLSATMALNGFIAMGVSQDWATHMIGHELTALHGLTHGHTLVIVFLVRCVCSVKQKVTRFCNMERGCWALRPEAVTNASMKLSAAPKNFSVHWD